jgi:hypothetical protein
MSEYRWVGDNGVIHVWFDEDRVTDRDFHPAYTTEQTKFENLLWRAKRQWHRWFPE